VAFLPLEGLVKSLLLFLFIFISTQVGSTTFIVTPIEVHIEKASGIIHGQVLATTAKKLPDGKIVTQVSLSLLATSGIENGEIVSKNNFQVLTLGGSWNGVRRYVEGSPEFKVGEEVVLFVNKADFGFALSNLGLGKYVVKEVEKRKVLVNSILPENPLIGKLDFEDFKNKVRLIRGKELLTVKNDLYIEKNGPEIGGKRRPASSQEDDSSHETPINVIWIVLAFGILGFISTLITRKTEIK